MGGRPGGHGGRGCKGEARPLRCLLFGDCSVRACVKEAGNRRKEKRRKEKKEKRRKEKKEKNMKFFLNLKISKK
jgi:hypothetical protein